MDPKVLALLVFLFIVLACPAMVLAWICIARTTKVETSDDSGATRSLVAQGRVHAMRVPFFLLAALFMVFEMGVLILIPWALGFNWAVQSGLGGFSLVHAVSFIVFFAIALVFAIGSGALDWKT